MFKKIAAVFAVIMGMAIAVPAMAQGVNHKIVFHVDQNDPKVMNLTLNNVQNVTAYFESIGDTVEIEVVAYGPGLNMFLAETSPVADRIAVMSLQNENLTFAACGNTLKKFEARAGAPIEVLPEAVVVPSGVVQLVLRQEQGWSYIKP